MSNKGGDVEVYSQAAESAKSYEGLPATNAGTILQRLFPLQLCFDVGGIFLRLRMDEDNNTKNWQNTVMFSSHIARLITHVNFVIHV